MAFKDSTDEKFQDQINGSKLNLIQFSASWCGPCQNLKPIIEKISNDMAMSLEIFSIIGFKFWHGPHQLAENCIKFNLLPLI